MWYVCDVLYAVVAVTVMHVRLYCCLCCMCVCFENVRVTAILVWGTR